MKIYGIAAEYWGGNSYSCCYDEDIRLFLDKENRDIEFAKLKDNGDVQHYRFEAETED